MNSDRDHFTKRGLHLNRKWKEQAAKTIDSSIEVIFKLQKKNHIKVSWKEEQKLEGVNTVRNNVDKDGDQIICEEQANRDQEQRKTNCPLNEPGDYPVKDTMIFYGWTPTQINKCSRY